jgi:N-acetyl-gamma-glutamyl-phosphate reductase
MKGGTGVRKRVVIVGAAGYSGVELLSILLGHPGVEIVGLFGSDKGASAAAASDSPSIGELHPRFRGVLDLAVRPATFEAILGLRPDAVFLATPHAASHDLAPALVERGVIVLDLSASFRFREAWVYPKHYGFEHAHAGLLGRAVYGLVEMFREDIRKADLIAVPGCYPTSAILALAPLVKAGAIDASRRVIVDSISGVSGAGRSANVATLFCEVSLRPYEVFKHRHTPEIEAYAGTKVWFTPSVGPYERGIVSTIHAELNSGWDLARVRAVLDGAYDGERFVRVLKGGTWPSVAGVVRTNFCDIAVDTREGDVGADGAARQHLIMVSAIDNLVKGAAGQAVQCFNVRFGFAEGTALPGIDHAKGVA